MLGPRLQLLRADRQVRAEDLLRSGHTGFTADEAMLTESSSEGGSRDKSTKPDLMLVDFSQRDASSLLLSPLLTMGLSIAAVKASDDLIPPLEPISSFRVLALVA
jgi:hypothetical protein